ncbi:uncharacterized protein LOC126318629 [Schistocerca gregaria]|uniref:uncharacterized protein LOC126318629 n=1 Tax=Schistocerca gregaria TaxID=7010 RepID=UPI00211E1BC5|nr:uncharacterized protein LOC126318629 [Schistocerca gregaria]
MSASDVGAEGSSEDDDVAIDTESIELSRQSETDDGLESLKESEEEGAVVLPKYKICLEWRDIFLEVKQGGKKGSSDQGKRVILDHLSGTILPGEFWAIMGPTGCGKTTLLNVLSGRKVTDVKGEILANGKARDKNWKRQTSYVMQDDILFPIFTVYQTLLFQASIRLGKDISHKEKKRKVERLIDMLKLTKARNTVIGNQFIRGVSGGERKRVSIGVQLLTESGIIFLDEPTSGLDATSAFHIVKMLKSLSNEGYAIVMTIHQPSIDIFELFDKLLILIDGHVVYSGTAPGSYSYLSSIDMECPVSRNPADFIMEAFVMNSMPANAKEDNTRSYLINRWNDHANTPSFVQSDRERVDAVKAFLQSDQSLSQFRKFPPGYRSIFLALAKRSLQMSMGSYFLPLPIIQMLFIAIIFSLVWLQTPHDAANFRNRTGAIFFLILYAGGFSPLLNVLYSFPSEQPVILRERSEGAYPLSAYFLAKILSDAPFEQIYPLGFLLISYWIVGFNPRFTNFLLIWVILIFLTWSSSGLGLVVSSAVYNPRSSTTLATIILLIMILTSGFYVAFRSIKVWISWLGYLSYVKYAYDGMILVEIGVNTAIAQSSTTHFFVRNYGAVIGILLGYIIFFRVLSYFLLKFLFKAKT